MKPTTALIAVLIALVPALAQSATWRVAKDGSGAFTVIQEAVNVSAPGDTILIGPGRYDETAPYYLINSWTAETCIGVGIENITLLGEDRDSVIIGPSTPSYTVDGPHGIVSQIGIQDFHVENLTVENVKYGLVVFGRVGISNLISRGCRNGIYGFVEDGMMVEDCDISGCLIGISTQAPSRDVIIKNSSFSDNRPGVALVSSPNSQVSGCTFTGGTGGVQFDRGTTGRVFDCTFMQQSNYSVLSIYSDMDILNNFFGKSYYGSIFSGLSVVTGSGNIFEAGVASTLRLDEGPDVSLHDNHIFFDTGYSVWVRGGADAKMVPTFFLISRTIIGAPRM